MKQIFNKAKEKSEKEFNRYYVYNSGCLICLLITLYATCQTTIFFCIGVIMVLIGLFAQMLGFLYTRNKCLELLSEKDSNVNEKTKRVDSNVRRIDWFSLVMLILTAIDIVIGTIIIR